MIELPAGVVLENLTVEQRQALVDRELQKWQRSAQVKAELLHGVFHSGPLASSCAHFPRIESLQMLVVLVWRHVAIYANNGVDPQSLGASIRIAPSFSSDSFRSDVARKLTPLLHRLYPVCTDRIDNTRFITDRQHISAGKPGVWRAAA